MHDLEDLQKRAWEIRRKVEAKVIRNLSSEHSLTLWKDTLGDVQKGFSEGPYFHEDQVSDFLGTSSWIAMPRFPVVQGTKVRPVDDGSETGSEANLFAAMIEKLAVPSVDQLVAATRALKKTQAELTLGSWVVDEKSAFRQVPVRPDHRRVAIIALGCPSTGKVAYFVVAGHPFGLLASVFNFNRREAILTAFLVKEFKLVSMSYHDDRFGVTTLQLAKEEAALVERVCELLGVAVNAKTQCGPVVEILGVTFDHTSERLLVKPARREALTAQIREILRRDSLQPGEAGKLRGKLQFVAGHFAEKHGRSFLRVLSERQFSSKGYTGLSPALRRSLAMWVVIISSEAGARSLPGEDGERAADTVAFTDGFHPEVRPWMPASDEPSRVGWCTFTPGHSDDTDSALFSSFVVTPDILSNWIDRRMQIGMVELFGAVLLVDAMGPAMRGKRVLLLIDNESVQGALIKGYSSISDQSDLIGYFRYLTLVYDICMFICRVPTDSNPADDPSRGRFTELFARGAAWKD